MEKFIDKFRCPSFAEKCSARQLVQAAAYPLAVGMNGAQGGWLSRDDAVSWARLVFDTLFQRVSPGERKHVGVLRFVEARFRRDDKEEVFREVVGDGTLWLTLLCSLADGIWRGKRAGFERALALRSVLKAKTLIGSTNNMQIDALLPRMRERADLLKLAVEYTERLNSLEEALRASWQKILSSQQEQKLVHEPEDLLWNFKGYGWAIAQERAVMKPKEKMDIYLKKRAKNVRVMASGFYVNVTKAQELRAMIDALVANEAD